MKSPNYVAVLAILNALVRCISELAIQVQAKEAVDTLEIEKANA